MRVVSSVVALCLCVSAVNEPEGTTNKGLYEPSDADKFEDVRFTSILLTLLISKTPILHAQLSLRTPIDALQWERLRAGMELTEFVVDAGRPGFDVRIVAARIDPAQFTFSLVHSTRANRMTGAWNVDVAPNDAALAINAGQFKETGPWGWLVLNGDERRPPGVGPLSAGIAFDSGGAIRWIPYERLEHARTDANVRFAFQSYPLILWNGRVPKLATNTRLVEQNHRDIRLVFAQDTPGMLLVVLTRYDTFGRAGSRVPIGLTLPESIALLRALGARHAVMLDGGVSAQMLLRNEVGTARVWKGMRDVPLALIARPRSH